MSSHRSWLVRLERPATVRRGVAWLAAVACLSIVGSVLGGAGGSARASSGGSHATSGTSGGSDLAVTASRRIRHVVIVYQENHSFDNLLGLFCVQHSGRHCNGVMHGRISSGRRIRLRRGPDIPPKVLHRPSDQLKAINGGRMNGFNLIPGCAELPVLRAVRAGGHPGAVGARARVRHRLAHVRGGSRHQLGIAPRAGQRQP
jgi:hypothetical protein